MKLYCFKSPFSVALSFAVMAESEAEAKSAVCAYLASQDLDPLDDYEVGGWPERYRMSVHEIGQVEHFSTRPE